MQDEMECCDPASNNLALRRLSTKHHMAPFAIYLLHPLLVTFSQTAHAINARFESTFDIEKNAVSTAAIPLLQSLPVHALG